METELEHPCPVYVDTPRGRKYCEVGPAGHAGSSHSGDRSQEEYMYRYNWPLKPYKEQAEEFVRSRKIW